MSGMSLGLDGLSLSATTGSGGTPTPTPGVATTIFYDETDSAFEVTNPEVITTSSAWRVLAAGDDPAPGDSVISGQTTTSLSPTEISVGQGAYHVPDGDWSRHSNVLHRIPAIPAPTITHYPSSGQPDGNDLTDYGWTAFNKPALMSIVSGVWTITQNYSNEGGWSKDLSTTDHAIKVVHAYVNNSSDDTNHFDLAVRYGDSTHFVKASGSFSTGGDGFNLQVQVGGVTTVLTPGNIHFATNVDNNSIELVARGNTLYLYMNDVLQVPNPDGDYVTDDNGYDIGFASSLASNTKVAVLQLGANTLNEQVAHDIVTSAYPAAPIVLTTSTFTAPLAASNYIKLEAVGTCPVGVTSMSLGWYDADGQPIYVQTGLTASGGAFDVSNLVTPHILRGQPATLMFWKTSDPTVIGYASRPKIPAYQLVGPTIIGPNFNLWSSIAGDYCRDRGLTMDFRDASNGSNVPVGASGFPTDTPNTGDHYNGLIFQSDKSHRTGQYVATYPSGVTVSNPYAENATIDSVNNTTREFKFTIADAEASVVVSAEFKPTPGVSGDVIVSCLPVGDAHPTWPVTDQCMADWSIDQGFRYARLMKQLGAEMGNNQLAADKLTVIKPRFMTPEYVAFLITDMGICPWLSFAIVETEAYITGFLTDLKNILLAGDGIPDWLFIIVEWGNEIWNWGTYQNQDHRARWMAVDRGFVPGVTAPEQGNVIYDFTPGSTLSAQTLEAGDVVYYDGYHCARAKRHINIGTQYPASSGDDNADFEFIATVTATHVHKVQGQGQDWLSGITKPIFADGIVKSALGIFIDDSIDDAWERVSDNGYWKSVDIVAPSGYLSNLSNYGDHGFDYDYATPATYATGLINFLTTDTSVGIPGTMTKLLTLKHGFEDRVCSSPDYTPGDSTPILSTYEINSHFGYVTNPPDDATLTTAMNYASKSDGWATMLTTYWNRIVSEIGGYHTPFVDVEARPAHFSSQWQMFGFLDNYTGARRSEQKPWAATSAIALAQLP